MKIILHVNEESRLEPSLVNIKNILTVQPESIVELLVHGSAINKLNDDSIINEIKSFDSKHAYVAVCNFSVKKFNFNIDDKVDFLNVVDSGMIELARKQKEGFIYIKP